MQTEKTPNSPFKKQLEKQALKGIIFLVIVGCLLFCIPIFGLNYLNLRVNMEQHLDFLNHTFDDVYGDAVAYLENGENEDAFLRCISGASDGRELKYSLSKHNVSGPVRMNLILTDPNRRVVYASFGEEEMNLHRTEFNRIVADNALKAGTSIYSTVYYFTGDHSECVFAKPLYEPPQ